MKKKMQLIGLITIMIIFSISGIFYYKNHRIINYETADFKDATEKEQEAINYFYKNKDMVIEGKCFDMKLTYFESRDYENIVIEVIKKVKDEIEIKKVTVTMGQQEEIKHIEHDGEYSKLSYTEHDSWSLFFLFENFKYLSRVDGGKLFNPLTEESDFKTIEGSITIKLKYDNSEEEFVLENNQEKQYNNLSEVNNLRKVGKWKSNPYLTYISYQYYSILFRVDFNQWLEGMNLIVSEIEYEKEKHEKANKSYLYLASMFHIPLNTGYDEEGLRYILNINDEQYKKYCELLSRVKDLGIESILPEFLKE